MISRWLSLIQFYSSVDGSLYSARIQAVVYHFVIAYSKDCTGIIALIARTVARKHEYQPEWTLTTQSKREDERSNCMLIQLYLDRLGSCGKVLNMLGLLSILYMVD